MRTENTIPVGFIENALVTVNKLLPNYNPIRQHAADEPHVTGASQFTEIKTVKEAIELTKDSLISIKHTVQAIYVTVAANRIIGKESTCLPEKGKVYLMKEIHGAVQPTAVNPEEELTSTNVFTFVITNEGNDQWAVASVFPGQTEEAPDATGLNDGDMIEGEELLRRGFKHVKEL